VSHAPAQRPAATTLRAAVAAGFVAFALLHVWTSLEGTFEPLIQRGLFVGGGLGFVFLDQAARQWRKSRPGAIVSVVWAALGFYGGLHVVANQERLMDIMADLTPLDMAAGLATIVVAVEAGRRTIGLSLPILAVLSLLFYAFGHDVLSGNWQPPRISGETAIATLYASTSGLFGMLADIGTRVVAVYVVFGSLLMAIGAGDAFIQAATLVAGRTHGGPAKVAVVTSALFGTISGSSVANVMSVGSITIPTMIRSGYRKAFAAGIEATASAGGQIMPPVMGAGAFIMAELLNIPYATIALAAALPACLYFSAIYFSIDCYARENHLLPVPREQIPTAREVFLSENAVAAFLPLLLLAWLLFSGYTPTFAGAAATLALIVIAAAIRVVAVLRGAGAGEEARRFIGQIWNGLADGGKSVIVIAALLATASLLVTVLSASGVGVKFSQMLLGFSGQTLAGVLIMSAVLCIALGMDVPTTASYLLTASVAGPALIKLGLAPLTAHLFIFYFAVLSAITPPVCASVFAAATIAGENFWKVARQALRIAGAVFLIPFMMVYRVEITLMGSWPWIAYHMAIAWVMVVAISGASIGHLAGSLRWPARLWLYAGAAALFYPSPYADALGVGIVGLFFARQWLFPVRAPA
jgi:TRAP transporter 4TM/12TM fusion protein